MRWPITPQLVLEGSEAARVERAPPCCWTCHAWGGPAKGAKLAPFHYQPGVPPCRWATMAGAPPPSATSESTLRLAPLAPERFAGLRERAAGSQVGGDGSMLHVL
jgi:hypothetical protein